MIIHLLLVAIGGFFGSIGRFFVARLVHGRLVGTWIANVTGSLLLAVILRLYLNDFLSESLFLLLGVGFSGAYTTFSTFGYETISLVINKKYLTAFLYIITSFFISVSLVVLVL